MPKTVIPVRFVPGNGTGYLTDIGTDIGAKGRFILPPDVSAAQVSTILSAIGAEPLSSTTGELPCPDTTNAQLRKLEFIRENGGSMSVPVSSRVDLIGAATVIRGVLNSAGSDVACIKLHGEEFPNLADELGLAYNNTFATSHVPVGGGKQFIHAGTISYETDATSGTLGTDTVFQPVKSLTDVDGSAASLFGTAWSTCVGAFLDTLPCRGKGRRNPRKHRRFILTVRVGNTTTNATEFAEIPVKDAEAAQILTCGQAAAALSGVYCIGYMGESYSRFHKLLP
jgi:hypothetical protein